MDFAGRKHRADRRDYQRCCRAGGHILAAADRLPDRGIPGDRGRYLYTGIDLK